MLGVISGELQAKIARHSSASYSISKQQFHCIYQICGPRNESCHREEVRQDNPCTQHLPHHEKQLFLRRPEGSPDSTSHFCQLSRSESVLQCLNPLLLPVSSPFSTPPSKHPSLIHSLSTRLLQSIHSPTMIYGLSISVSAGNSNSF